MLQASIISNRYPQNRRNTEENDERLQHFLVYDAVFGKMMDLRNIVEAIGETCQSAIRLGVVGAVTAPFLLATAEPSPFEAKSNA